jgi:hypothetical protein
MISCNLTPNQKNLLRWLVQETQDGKLEGEFTVTEWVFHEGMHIVGLERPFTFFVSDLEALEAEGLLWLRGDRGALTQKAYAAVSSDFADPIGPLPSQAGTVINNSGVIGVVTGAGSTIENVQATQTIVSNDLESFQAGIAEITNAITQSQEISAETRQVCLDLIRNLQNQEALLPEKRMGKAAATLILEKLGTCLAPTANATTILQHWGPQIAAFFHG